MKYLFILLPLLILSACNQGAVQTTPDTSKTSATIASPTYGSGEHTLTVFADFQCPACINFSIKTDTNKGNVIGNIFEDYASRGLLTITYKQFPLTSMHRNAERDAIAALCSAEQGSYMAYKKVLYALEETKKGASVSDEERVKIGEGILDTAKLEQCLKEDRYLTQVRSEMAEGPRLGVTGTPTILLDGKKLDNSLFRDLNALKNAMDQLLGSKTPATATGTNP